jgi:hypothetical protein
MKKVFNTNSLKFGYTLDLLQKSDTRQKIYFLADNSSRFQPTNNSIFSPFQRTFAIRQRLESLTVQVFLQEVYSNSETHTK